MTEPTNEPTDGPDEANVTSASDFTAPGEQPTWSRIAEEGEPLDTKTGTTKPEVDEDDNPYPKLQTDSDRVADDASPARRPSSLSAPATPPVSASREPIPVSPPTAEEQPVPEPTQSTAEANAPSEEPAANPGTAVAAQLNALRQERPEVLVGAAFAGGLIFAAILKRLARR